MLLYGWGLLLLSSCFLDPRVQGQPAIRALSGSLAHLSVPDLLGSYQELTWFFWSGRSISKIVLWDPKSTHYYQSQLQGRVCLSNSSLLIWDLHPSDSRNYTLRVLRPDGTQEERTHYYQSQLQGRVCLSNSSLLIWDLHPSDSRNYTLRVLRPDGTQEERTLLLQVLEPVPTPVIIVKDLRLEDSCCVLNLTCVVSSPLATLNISWKGSTGSSAKASPGQVLKVATKEMPMTYNCTAYDTLSSRTSSVTFTHCAAPSSGELVRATWLLVLVPLILQALLF